MASSCELLLFWQTSGVKLAVTTQRPCRSCCCCFCSALTCPSTIKQVASAENLTLLLQAKQQHSRQQSIMDINFQFIFKFYFDNHNRNNNSNNNNNSISYNSLRILGEELDSKSRASDKCDNQRRSMRPITGAKMAINYHKHRLFWPQQLVSELQQSSPVFQLNLEAMIDDLHAPLIVLYGAAI